MNTSKLKPTGAAVPGKSRIPIKRPVPVSSSTITRHEPVAPVKPKPVPTITTQPSNPTTPKHKNTLESNGSKIIDTKVPQTTQPNNRENKENFSLNSTKKPQVVTAKGYMELKKSEERLLELVNRLEFAQQNHSQQILAIEQKHKDELRAKDEIIRNLQFQLEASQKRTQSAENDLNALHEDFSTLTARNKSLESLLEEVNVDVVALQRINAVVNTEDIERRFQEFKESFELDYENSLKLCEQKKELLAQMSRVDLSIPEFDEGAEEGQKS